MSEQGVFDFNLFFFAINRDPSDHGGKQMERYERLSRSKRLESERRQQEGGQRARKERAVEGRRERDVWRGEASPWGGGRWRRRRTHQVAH